MKKVFLSDICEICSGQPAPQDSSCYGEDGVPFIRAGSLEKLIRGESEQSLELIEENTARKYSLRLFPRDTVLFAKSGMSAKIGRIYRLCKPSYVVSHLAAIIPGEKIHPGYLQRWFEHNPPSRLIPNESYPSIRLSEIGKLKIHVPLYSDQEKIAGVLDLADGLRQKRKKSLQLLDDLVRAEFIEMFGDPLSKKPKFPVVRLGDVVGFCGGGTPSRAIPEYYQGQHKWASSKDMKGLILRDTQERVSEKAIEKCATKLVKAGTLLIVVKSKILMRYLPVMITGTEVCFNQDIKGITPSKDVNPWYLLFHLRIGQDALLRVARGANTEGLTLDHLREYELIRAPKDLQDRFSGIAQKAVALSEKMQDGQAALDNQFNALMQRYFE